VSCPFVLAVVVKDDIGKRAETTNGEDVLEEDDFSENVDNPPPPRHIARRSKLDRSIIVATPK